MRLPAIRYESYVVSLMMGYPSCKLLERRELLFCRPKEEGERAYEGAAAVSYLPSQEMSQQSEGPERPGEMPAVALQVSPAFIAQHKSSDAEKPHPAQCPVAYVMCKGQRCQVGI